MAIPSLRDFLRWTAGKDKKEESVFASEKEAYEFCLRAYRDWWRDTRIAPSVRILPEDHE
jgi:hypothetical protein